MTEPDLRGTAGRTVFAESDDGVAVVAADPEAGYPVVEANDAFLHVAEPDGGPVAGGPLSQVLPREILNTVVGNAAEVLASGRTLRTQVERRERARRRSYLVTLCPLPETDADPPHLLLIVRDVTALRRLTRTLRETQRLARLGHWSWDLETDEVRWSRELHRLFGLDPESFEASYEAYLEQVHPDDREDVDAAIRRARHEGGTFEFEHRITAPDGEVRRLHCRGRLIEDADGRPVRMTGTAQAVDG